MNTKDDSFFSTLPRTVPVRVSVDDYSFAREPGGIYQIHVYYAKRAKKVWGSQAARPLSSPLTWPDQCRWLNAYEIGKDLRHFQRLNANNPDILKSDVTAKSSSLCRAQFSHRRRRIGFHRHLFKYDATSEILRLSDSHVHNMDF